MTTTQTAALALFGGADQGGKVLPHLDQRNGRWAADAFKACSRVHTGSMAATSNAWSGTPHDSPRLSDDTAETYLASAEQLLTQTARGGPRGVAASVCLAAAARS
ncbi:hypothetical protein GCM10022255_000950 [Dactylosporangium darangshiense]|uniref:Uncharacterized protein n=1 Tax=Dactylosporangium darangshiense TaxID=579108 RepID=A0ABP8CTC2_9ACTN